MKIVKLYNYIVTESGEIYNSYGKKMKMSKQITVLNDDRQYIKISYARFIYYAFHPTEFDLKDKTKVVIHKNKNYKGNINNVNNLKLVSRKDILQGENSPSVKLTEQDIEDIKRIYSNKQKAQYKNDPYTKVSYRSLAEQYGVSHTLIENIVLGKNRNSDNYILK